MQKTSEAFQEQDDTVPPIVGKDIDQIIGDPVVERLTDSSRTSRWRWERQGLFPRRVKLGPRRVGWRKSEILEWIASRTA